MPILRQTHFNKERTMSKQWNVYLSGEIHSDWRQRIEAGAADLPITFTAPVTDHGASDNCGVEILGAEENSFWKDHKGAQINAIRTRTLIRDADVVVVRFGDQYRQWNAAFEAGYAHALGIPIVTLHNEELVHPLKEIDSVADGTAQDPSQIVELLKYLLKEY